MAAQVFKLIELLQRRAMSSYSDLFHALGRVLPNYQARPEQQKLAVRIGGHLHRPEVLLVEAGTGTGKTLSYLLPALVEHRPDEQIVISTATHTLQEQIYQKDLPLCQRIYPNDLKVVLLKGWQNYLCLYQYEELQSRLALDREEQRQLDAVAAFRRQTADGDLALLRGVPENAPLRRELTISSEECLKRSCPLYEKCFAVAARRQAQRADIVLVNHALLLSDLSLRFRPNSDAGVSLLGPRLQAIIVDEAHHLPQLVSNRLGRQISGASVQQLFSQSAHRAQEQGHKLPGEQKLKRLLKDLAAALGPGSEDLSEISGDELRAKVDFWARLDELRQLASKTGDELSALALRQREDREEPEDEDEREERQRQLALLETLGRRWDDLADRLDHCQGLLQKNGGVLTQPAAGEAWAPTKALALSAIDQALVLPAGAEVNTEALWADRDRRGFVLHAEPVQIQDTFAHWVKTSGASWTLLSATLSTNGNFDYFCGNLGLSSVQTAQLPSPFDYRRQTLLYHPDGLPPPNHPRYEEALIEVVLPVLRQSRGRAFLLFTSHGALRRCADRLRPLNEFQLLVQGAAGKNELLERFKTLPRAVLLATASFWEGVDVPGPALVCVVIDKLPFAVPTGPVVKLRHQLLRARGLDPFTADSLPQAIMMLKQGVGRLIRSEKDYGVLLLADPRLSSKSYGSAFLHSLPRMTQTRRPEVVERFYRFHENHNDPNPPRP